MINPLNLHYSFNNPASIHDEEALTALELAGRQGAKINEVVKDQNALRTETETHLVNQDNTIAERMNRQDADISHIRTVTVPADVTKEVQKQIDNGTFDEQIDQSLGNLADRVDNLLGSVTEGSTTLDAELIDLRTAANGTNYNNAGQSIRTQFNSIHKVGVLFFSGEININFDTENAKVSTDGRMYTLYNKSMHEVPAFELDFVANVNIVVFNTSTKLAEIVKSSDYDRNTQIVLFVFVRDYLNKNVYSCTLPCPYYVNGIKKTVYPEPETPVTNVEMFATTGNPYVSFDTKNMTLSLSAFYIQRGSVRYDMEACVLDIPEGNTKYLVLNKTARSYEIVQASAFDKETQIPLFLFNMRFLIYPYSNTIPFEYTVDGVKYNRFNHNTTESTEEKIRYLKPGADIQSAIDAGYNTIVFEGGEYPAQLILVENKDKVRFIVRDGAVRQRKHKKNVVIDNSILLDIVRGDLETCTASFTADETSNWYKVFVSKELEPVRTGKRSKTYNCILWECDADNPGNDRKLVPVLTLEECEATVGTFYYNHTTGTVTIHPYDTSIENVEYRRLNIEEGNLLTVHTVNQFYMENIEIKYPPEYAVLRQISDCEVRNCIVDHTAYSGGFKIDGVNGSFHSCESFKVCADGFGIGGSSNGHTEYYDCSGHHCYDDGISHHNGSTGVIYGGIWHHNTKGGIAPAHGSVVHIHNAICHNNGFGFYCESDDVEPTALGRKIYHTGCVAYDNNVGISVNRYNLQSFNCKYDNNTEPTRVYENEYTSLTVL